MRPSLHTAWHIALATLLALPVSVLAQPPADQDIWQTGTADEEVDTSVAPEPSEPVDTAPPEPVEPPAEPAGAGASAAVPLDVTASFFVRYDLRAGYDNVGLAAAEGDIVRYRTRFGLIAGPLELDESLQLTLRFVPQASGIWYVGGNALEDAELGLHEGLVQLGGETWRLDAGRFEMVYGDHLVIGNVGWHQTGRSFDGLRLHLEPGDLWVDGFFTLIGEGSLTPGDQDPLAGDTYFAGLYAGLGGLIEEGFALDAYVLLLSSVGETALVGDPPMEVDVDGSNRVTLGSRVKHDAGLLDYRLEAGIQLGSAPADQSIFAWHGDLEVGVQLLDDALRVAVEGFYATGDDPDSTDTNEAWNHLFPTAHKWMGFADIIGARSNVTGGVLHLALSPADGWKINADGHLFVRPEDTIDATDPMMPVTIESGMAGIEGDFGVAYTIAAGLRARTNYSLFLPSEDWYGTTDTAHFWELELRYDR